MVKKTKKELSTESETVKTESYNTIKHSSLTLVNNPQVRTHYINGSIDFTTLKDFQTFIKNVIDENQTIEINEKEAKNKKSFKAIHEPDAKPEYESEQKPKVERINLVIDSGGGFVTVMLSIVALMKTCPIPIDTYCFGHAMSAAFFIFLHGKRRYIGQGSSFMTHSIASMAWDNVPNMKIRIEYLNNQNKYAQQEISKRTGLTLEWLTEKEHIDVFFTDKEALDAKIGDVYIVD